MKGLKRQVYRTFPMETSNDPAELAHRLRNELGRMKVLLVDKQPKARDTLRMMLSALGVVSVSGAGNSTEALRQVKGGRFDIILSDYLLDDGRDGQQLLEELRFKHLIPLSTVFMIVTSERHYHNVVSVAELAPDDYLIKPFTADRLQQRLIQAIYRKHVFARAYEAAERGDHAQTIAACEEVARTHREFVFDALRFLGETLNSVGRYEEAEGVYRRVIERKELPWARMGLAIALRGRGERDEAAALAERVVAEHPEYLAAYDLVAKIHEEAGDLDLAQATLQAAAGLSPHNTIRQRIVGDIALRNQDLDVAERAYSVVLDRSRGSSLRTVDDYANLARVLVDKGADDRAKSVVDSLRRERRGDRQGELAALVIDSRIAGRRGDPTRAAKALDDAIALHNQLRTETAGGGEPSHRIAVDLADACLATGRHDEAEQLLRRAAAENHGDPSVTARILGVYESAGRPEAGKDLLDAVGQEIADLSTRSAERAEAGDLEGSRELAVEAAEKMPNVRLLVDAAKSIFTALDHRGWKEQDAALGLRYLQRAEAKSPRDPRVVSARDFAIGVARKYGIASLGGAGEKV